jgi:hypothetical protein
VAPIDTHVDIDQTPLLVDVRQRHDIGKSIPTLGVAIADL